MLLNRRISLFYFLRQIKFQILLLLAFAVVIGLFDLHPAVKQISLPLAIPALLGTAVSLLLAFRTSQSYERWWEARIVWGGIVNDSRTFIREVITFLPGQPDIARAFAERQIIWNYALGESLRRVPFSEKVQEYLRQNGIESINIPNALLDLHAKQLSELVQTGQLSEFRQMQLDDTIARLCDSMGKCERIKNTVFPKSYSLLLHTMIYIFAAILPFGLDDSQLVVEMLLSFLIPAMFIAIEKTAIIMQDPFENGPVDTPMTALAQTIEINILQMIGEKNVQPRKVSEFYYEM
ncbi:bestrophin family protein [Sediminibacterium ginsengisoli]|uniref:Putative membrane protein n=1 Tax=Sediminibacterium ginsengisoli TaxID=413434 RepID=A0A1T4P272_9BACT|nr:bestrophin family ion channel [Sediminibacterium ginsengisoli]SJZ85583.1 putative membrane protein [Sediminibacterium ginsengisoli]